MAGFEANGVGQTPSNSGAPMSTSSLFRSLKIVRRTFKLLLYYAIKILKIFFLYLFFLLFLFNLYFIKYSFVYNFYISIYTIIF